MLGAGDGWGAGWLLARSQARGWVDDAWARGAVVAAAIGAYGLALAVDGSGFISAWVAGLAFGAAIRKEALPRVAPVGETVAATVALSVLLHGVTSVWGSNRYGRWYERRVAAGEEPVEKGIAPERALRTSLRPET